MNKVKVFVSLGIIFASLSLSQAPAGAATPLVTKSFTGNTMNIAQVSCKSVLLGTVGQILATVRHDFTATLNSGSLVKPVVSGTRFVGQSGTTSCFNWLALSPVYGHMSFDKDYAPVISDATCAGSNFSAGLTAAQWAAILNKAICKTIVSTGTIALIERKTSTWTFNTTVNASNATLGLTVKPLPGDITASTAAYNLTTYITPYGPSKDVSTFTQLSF